MLLADFALVFSFHYVELTWFRACWFCFHFFYLRILNELLKNGKKTNENSEVKTLLKFRWTLCIPLIKCLFSVAVVVVVELFLVRLSFDLEPKWQRRHSLSLVNPCSIQSKFRWSNKTNNIFKKEVLVCVCGLLCCCLFVFFFFWKFIQILLH